MELIIYNPKEDGFIKYIDWNFEDLKTEIIEKANDYMALVYSDDQIKEAKKDRANLNKFKKALDDKRKEVKKQVMNPYTAFELQIKELSGIVDEAVANIDKQIKDYEEIARQEKEKRCREIYEETIGDMGRIVTYEKAFNEKWLKKTTTEKQIRMEISFLRDRVDAELKTITADASPFVFEMKEEYLKEFDLNAAMSLKQHLEETEKKKKLFEQEQKLREEERKRALEEEARRVHKAGEAVTDKEAKPGKPERVIRVTFTVVARESQFKALNEAINELKANSESVEIVERKEM